MDIKRNRFGGVTVRLTGHDIQRANSNNPDLIGSQVRNAANAVMRRLADDAYTFQDAGAIVEASNFCAEPRKWAPAEPLPVIGAVYVTKYADEGGWEWGYRVQQVIRSEASGLSVVELKRVSKKAHHNNVLEARTLAEFNKSFRKATPDEIKVYLDPSTPAIELGELWRHKASGSVATVKALRANNVGSAWRVVYEMVMGGEGGSPYDLFTKAWTPYGVPDQSLWISKPGRPFPGEVIVIRDYSSDTKMAEYEIVVKSAKRQAALSGTQRMHATFLLRDCIQIQVPK